VTVEGLSMEIADLCDAAERRWFASLREEDAQLVNGTDGGATEPRRISKAQPGFVKSPELTAAQVLEIGHCANAVSQVSKYQTRPGHIFPTNQTYKK
jgi:hypothetical protein